VTAGRAVTSTRFDDIFATRTCVYEMRLSSKHSCTLVPQRVDKPLNDMGRAYPKSGTSQRTTHTVTHSSAASWTRVAECTHRHTHAPVSLATYEPSTSCSMMFSNFTSRCMSPLLCMYCSAPAICSTTARASSSEKAPWRAQDMFTYVERGAINKSINQSINQSINRVGFSDSSMDKSGGNRHTQSTASGWANYLLLHHFKGVLSLDQLHDDFHLVVVIERVIQANDIRMTQLDT
jgi:hypothetical protein